jgi:ATP-dependent RNA helicase RhlE
LTTFTDLNLIPALLNALKQEGYETPTPIQSQSIPHLLAGRDLLGIAQTGTGKTAAFALPILQKLAAENRHPVPGSCRALILSPTRELASQIHESFQTYGKNLRLKSAVVFGGVGIGKQVEAAKRGLDIVVATPGRLVDLLERRALSLAKIEVFVLDEVDQMLDLGFIHAIRKITGLLPKQRQNLFFSATMPKEIAGLAANLLKDPVRVEITPVATTAERVTQNVIHVDPGKKAALLVELLKDNNMTRTLVFTRTKHGADKVVKTLVAAGYNSAAIHGNKSQVNREKALAGFKAGKVLALVATDIAARGIDIDGVSHVVNYDLPFVPESYVHRIGRTARAGALGEAIAFCTPEDRGLLRDIEKTIRQAVPVKEHPLGLKVDELAPNFGWDPGSAKRKSGGGRHMPKADRQPHRGRGGKPQMQPNEGRSAHGDVRPPQVRTPKRDWTPAAVNGGQVERPVDGSQRFARGEADRKPFGDRPRKPYNAGKPQGDRPHTARPQGAKPQGDRPHGAPTGNRPPKYGSKTAGGFHKPKRDGASGGNWMKQIGGE